MRLDRGVRIFTPTTIKPYEKVWVPYIDGWYPGVMVDSVSEVEGDYDEPHVVVVEFSVLGQNDSLSGFPLWQLREYKGHLADKGKPDEPVPPTIGRPRGNPAKKLVGILQNGSVRGRC